MQILHDPAKVSEIHEYLKVLNSGELSIDRFVEKFQVLVEELSVV